MILGLALNVEYTSEMYSKKLEFIYFIGDCVLWDEFPHVQFKQFILIHKSCCQKASWLEARRRGGKMG